jgi:hypothetical protein
MNALDPSLLPLTLSKLKQPSLSIVKSQLISDTFQIEESEFVKVK